MASFCAVLFPHEMSWMISESVSEDFPTYSVVSVEPKLNSIRISLFVPLNKKFANIFGSSIFFVLTMYQKNKNKICYLV